LRLKERRQLNNSSRKKRIEKDKYTPGRSAEKIPQYIEYYIILKYFVVPQE
jgi:hypothetical protein